eukprot:scaffold2808_cov255-Pinguiococcus_pyrenoidosus.AAC.17
MNGCFFHGNPGATDFRRADAALVVFPPGDHEDRRGAKHHQGRASGLAHAHQGSGPGGQRQSAADRRRIGWAGESARSRR